MRSISSKPEPWQEALRLMSKCPICSHPYPSEGIKFFLRSENGSLVHSTCGHCQSSFVAMVLALGKGASSVGMVTDLSYDDVRRLYDSQPVTIDEIIDGHRFLENNSYQISEIKNFSL